VNAINNNALNIDLKDFGKNVLSDMLSKKVIENVIFQIQKIRNISAPKANEDSQAAPRMLKIILTDGHSHCQAIEIENQPGLNLSKTAPGVKILITRATVRLNYIILSANSCKILGGKVPALYERWELNKNMSGCNRQEGDREGPPPWINFGQRSAISNTNKSSDFKSLEAKEKKVSEFEVQRQDAIDAIAGGAVKKVFGGGIKVSTRNGDNEERRKIFSTTSERSSQHQPFEKRQERVRKGRKNFRDDGDEEKLQRPSENVSLFSYLENKLGSTSVSVSQSQDKSIVDNKRENKIESNQYQKPKAAHTFNHVKKYNQQNDISTRSENKTKEITNKLELLDINPSTNFARVALKHHLNFFGNTESIQSGAEGKWPWKVGDQCMAKYWEDNKFYGATIAGMTERTCVVQFNDYGNMEEVLHEDCIPVSREDNQSRYGNRGGYRNRGTNRGFNQANENFNQFDNAKDSNNQSSGGYGADRNGSQKQSYYRGNRYYNNKSYNKKF